MINKVILICGKMCSGKSTYAKSLIKKSPAVLLSTDELTTLFFGPHGGAEHHVIVEKTQKYLLNKSLEIIEAGIDVILDWGFWKQSERQDVTVFYQGKDISIEWHYIDTSNEICLSNLNKRNMEIETGQNTHSFHFPPEVAARFWTEMFDVPDKDEMDIRVLK